MHYPVMSERQVADRWGVRYATLNRWRLDGEGPVWHQLFCYVRYHKVDVLEFEQRGAQHQMTLLDTNREVKPDDEDVDAADDTQGSCYLSATEIAEAASLPIHLFRDQVERNRKCVPHLILVGHLRFSLQAVLDWEMANSVKGNPTIAAAAKKAEVPAKP